MAAWQDDRGMETIRVSHRHDVGTPELVLRLRRYSNRDDGGDGQRKNRKWSKPRIMLEYLKGNMVRLNISVETVNTLGVHNVET